MDPRFVKTIAMSAVAGLGLLAFVFVMSYAGRAADSVVGGPLTVDGPLVVHGRLTVGGPAEVHGGVRALGLVVGGPVEPIYPKGEPPGARGQTIAGSTFVGGPLKVNGPLIVEGKLTIGGPLKTEVSEGYDQGVTE